MHSPDPALLELLDRLELTRGDVADLLAETRRLVAADVAEAVDTEIPIVHFDELRDRPDPSSASSLGPDSGGDSGAGSRVGESIRRSGCVVVKGTFEPSQAERWDREIGEYLAANEFERKFAERYEDADQRSSIWGIYWSKPQVEARQHERMAGVRRFLNSLWSHESNGTTWFDPDHDIAYPDRLRRRAPGVRAKGLLPHSDSASAGGWRVAENIDVFRLVLAGTPELYDPFDAAHRTSVDAGSLAPATVFRTFQGWTALSEMHPTDGVLHLAPVPRAAAYVLVRGIADELGIEGDPTPTPRRARPDGVVTAALRPIPIVEPGDTVWWHGDVFHSVADASNETRWGNVMYIGAAPRCPRNDRYAASTLERFVRGASPLDFPEEDFEVEFSGRAGPHDLTALGRQQFGLEPIG